VRGSRENGQRTHQKRERHGKMLANVNLSKLTRDQATGFVRPDGKLLRELGLAAQIDAVGEDSD
jgi:hypothetical protein